MLIFVLEDSIFDDESMMHNVETLVSDSTPCNLPMNFGEMSREVSRSNTPAFPPGLPNPHGHPAPAVREDPIGKPSKILPVVAPFTPSRQSSMSNAPRVATPRAMSRPSTPSPVKSKVLPVTASEAPTSQTQTKQELKNLATTSGMAKAITALASTPTPTVPTTPLLSAAVTPATQRNLSTEEYPALGAQKEIKPSASRKVSKTVASSSKAPSTPKISNAQKSAKTTEKKATPAILTITTSAKPAPKAVGAPETPSKVTASVSDFPSLPASKPPQTIKSIKVTQTPKTELLPMGSPAPTSATSVAPYLSHFGRQFSSSEVPDTPSELDNASIMSATASRASSPAPSRSGQSRPPKLNTAQKNKLKMEKKEKALEAQMAAAAESKRTDEEQAPVLARKTKQRKEKTNVSSAASGSTPAASRPVSPPPAVIAREESKIAEPVIPEKPASGGSDKPVSKSEAKGKNKAKAQQPTPPPEPPRAPIVEDEEVAEKLTAPTSASLIQQLQSDGSIPNILRHPFFNTPFGVGNEKKREKDTTVAVLDSNVKLHISAEERADLNAGKPVHKIASGSYRIMLTPNGDCVRNLTAEEEERFLELQKTLSAEAGPTAFYSAKHIGNTGYNMIGGRAVTNGLPSYFPSVGPSNTTTLDPVSKIQRDEALSYINQYVLPSLSNNAQLEKALSANALSSDTLQGSDPSSWAPLNRGSPANLPEFLTSPSGDDSIEAGIENFNRGPQAQNVQLLSEKESESAMHIAKKETQELEKRLLAVLKKNRKMLLTGH
ncbi:hypothetical protein NHQ30_010948 [Ciborinia camelliae]|nr:hypothetical protein NHQ30_010948 [Ciborinia camelliae]